MPESCVARSAKVSVSGPTKREGFGVTTASRTVRDTGFSLHCYITRTKDIHGISRFFYDQNRRPQRRTNNSADARGWLGSDLKRCSCTVSGRGSKRLAVARIRDLPAHRIGDLRDAFPWQFITPVINQIRDKLQLQRRRISQHGRHGPCQHHVPAG